MMYSYSSEVRGFAGRTRDALSLYRLHSNDTTQRVRRRVEAAKRMESLIYSEYGIRLENRDVLEVGPGQFLTQLTYFALKNRAVGIDSDVIVRGFDIAGYFRMLRRNDPYRVAKTIGRKVLGVDGRYAAQLKSYLGVPKLPYIPVHTMDVRNMNFADRSFDFLYCIAVLHHLTDPATALDEIVRVLRPGGIAYISIHPFTSETGCLDPRIYTKRGSEVAGWPHLRPGLTDKLQIPNASLNRYRLADWRKLYEAKMPGASEFIELSGTQSRKMAESLQAQGELLEYSLEELLAGDFVVLWQKPLTAESN